MYIFAHDIVSWSCDDVVPSLSGVGGRRTASEREFTSVQSYAGPDAYKTSLLSDTGVLRGRATHPRRATVYRRQESYNPPSTDVTSANSRRSFQHQQATYDPSPPADQLHNPATRYNTRSERQRRILQGLRGPASPSSPRVNK